MSQLARLPTFTGVLILTLKLFCCGYKIKDKRLKVKGIQHRLQNVNVAFAIN